ncbi:hypothetical protein [Halobacterium salinarum]|uniref:hypothetical protein n=1 Tax=Halobacterium salinarum TaxID=2242 RepID=UPI002557159E|nr:hypothetical protein [Halobacterium salinarum]MDL0127042.1 hypothetical protein [Halobacterium salinarum]
MAATATGVDVLADVEVRALTEKMTTLADIGRAQDAPGLYLVVSESGASYLVDYHEQRCECPSQFYRGGECKHLARVAYATQDRTIPGWVDQRRVDEQLGAHITEGGQR